MLLRSFVSSAACFLSLGLVAGCGSSDSSATSTAAPGSTGGTSPAGGANNGAGGASTGGAETGGSSAQSGGSDTGTGGTSSTSQGGQTSAQGGTGGTPDLGGNGGQSTSGGQAGQAGQSTGQGGADTSGDGAPTRNKCLQVPALGTALTAEYGRLDGYLVSVVPTTQHGCNGDDHHVHLQVMANGAVYDVAIDVLSDMGTGDAADVFFYEEDAAFPGTPWAEGWHPGVAFDYVHTLKLHSTAFAMMDEPTLEMTVDARLATVNHISILGTGYGPAGMHDIHFKSINQDGALILQPTSATPHFLLFHFSDQTF